MGAKSKGNAYEREICKTLSKWYSNGERDDIYWRSDSSGGRAKFRKRHQGKSTYGQYGDIQAVDPIGQPLLKLFTIETKRGYSKYTILDMLDKRPHMALQKWEEHIHQVMEDSKNAGSKSWMLISRRNMREALVDVPLPVMKLLGRCGAKIYSVPHIESFLESKNGKRISVYTTQFSNFLKIVKPEYLKAII